MLVGNDLRAPARALPTRTAGLNSLTLAADHRARYQCPPSLRPETANLPVRALGSPALSSRLPAIPERVEEEASDDSPPAQSRLPTRRLVPGQPAAGARRRPAACL